MESMANEVIDCIGKGVYNEEPIKCFRGVGKEDNFVFRDEDELKSLSLLSEERKKEDRTTYQASTSWAEADVFGKRLECKEEF